MKERIVIVFVAVILGLVVTTVGFFLYESTKVLPQDSKGTSASAKKGITPTPLDTSKQFLSVESPGDMSLTKSRTVTIAGKTNANNTLIISTNQEDVVVNPNSLGEFSASISIDAGANKIITRAVDPNGNEITDTKVVTFSTDDF